ncbi:MAG TPA: hypothetical protein VKT53_12145 [Candidatus Acidoferrum sp.]|nr:hypothetical protein [Candidatus Acidoferrum sp.]
MATKRPLAHKVIISPEDAVDALSRSGYLLENRIARTLEKFATQLLVNVAFVDRATSQVRELDVYCFKGQLSDYNEFFSCSAHLLIECVNNPQPIAFFRSTRDMNLYPLLAARPAWLDLSPIEETIHIEKFHNCFTVPLATNYCTFVTKKSGEWMVTHADEQHQEFSTLATMAQMTREKQLTVLEEMSRPEDAIEACGIEFIYPILVVEGTLFEVIQDAKGLIKLRSINRIRYGKSQIWNGTRKYSPIDVMTESYFPKFLRLVESDCRNALRLLEERSEDVLEAAKNRESLGERFAFEDYLP